MTHNGEFCQKSGLDWLKMAYFGHFAVFPSFPPKWGSDWLGMANFTRFTTFPIFCHQSISFLEKSQKVSFWGGGYIGKCFEFFNFFELFHIEVAQNDPQWWILPKKWFRLAPNANFGHFAGFSIFSPKMRLRLTRNGQFHPIHNFSHLLPPKHLIFWEIQRIFVQGGTSTNFLSFSIFLNHFTPKRLKMTHNGQFCYWNGSD